MRLKDGFRRSLFLVLAVEVFTIFQVELLPTKINQFIAFDGKGESVTIDDVVSAIPGRNPDLQSAIAVDIADVPTWFNGNEERIVPKAVELFLIALLAKHFLCSRHY